MRLISKSFEIALMPFICYRSHSQSPVAFSCLVALVTFSQEQSLLSYPDIFEEYRSVIRFPLNLHLSDVFLSYSLMHLSIYIYRYICSCIYTGLYSYIYILVHICVYTYIYISTLNIYRCIRIYAIFISICYFRN